MHIRSLHTPAVYTELRGCGGRVRGIEVKSRYVQAERTLRQTDTRSDGYPGQRAVYVRWQQRTRTRTDFLPVRPPATNRVRHWVRNKDIRCSIFYEFSSFSIFSKLVESYINRVLTYVLTGLDLSTVVWVMPVDRTVLLRVGPWGQRALGR
jgi:hypothetical protein